MQWTNEEVVRLIEEFRERRALWDSGTDEFRAHAVKAEAWTTLARSFGCEVAELRKKMNSLFASHRRERLRVRAGGRSKWFAYPHLGFLRAHLETPSAAAPPPASPAHRETEVHHEQESTPDEGRSEDEDGGALRLHHEVVVKDELPEPTSAPPSPPRRRPRPPLRRTRPLRARRPLSPDTVHETGPVLDRNIVRAIRSVTRAELRRGADGARDRDECDVFGEYIANALRKHDRRTRAMIKHAIGNILFEQEMKQYAVVSAPGRAAPADRNPLLLDTERGRARLHYDP